ncbi:MAG: 1-acyl-sn-glycerol-3-phosphate acyltransferase [Pirellulales bacterium]|nr:1-acyl-sn-glycerol-3-phosphate acyltransferase [Pirellulales bacterium]
MQDIVLDIPYKFVPPARGRFWQRILQPFNATYLRRMWGIESIDYRRLSVLMEALDAGDAVMLVPNHPRPSDPALVANLPSQIGRPLHFMASWHLFKQGWLQRQVIRQIGTFSVYREGTDRKSLNMAVELLAEGKRPLAVFGEGAVTRTNDVLHELADGVAFIARAAAKRREQAGKGRVVVLPMAIKYRFHGDINKAADAVLSAIEKRISWQPQSNMPVVERVLKLGDGLLTLKELEYGCQPRTGEYEQRLDRLTARILDPLEKEWVGGTSERSVIARARRLRSAILPDMVENKVTVEERARRWRCLADIYLAQQLSLYPPQYVRDLPTPERVLETIERFEEDVTDVARVHRPMQAIIQFGELIPVQAKRDRNEKSRKSADKLMQDIHDQMAGMLRELQGEAGELLPLPEVNAVSSLSPNAPEETQS